MPPVFQLDAQESIYFQRELEYIKRQTYDIRYPALRAVILLPVSTEAGPAAEAITYRQYTEFGLAKIIANYADDFPRVDVQGKEFTGTVKSIGEAYGYSIQDIRAAQRAGKRLAARKATAARRANDQLVNKIGWFGDSEYNLQGFIDYPGITEYTVQNPGGGTEFANKTPDQILTDLNGITNKVVDLTKGVEMPNTMLLPLTQYTHITSTPRSANSDTTILEYFLSNSAFIRSVEWVNELKGAGAGGTDRMSVYDRSPDKLTFELPSPFEQFPPQLRGLEYVVHCHSRIGGVIVYYPLSVAYGDGI